MCWMQLVELAIPGLQKPGQPAREQQVEAPNWCKP